MDYYNSIGEILNYVGLKNPINYWTSYFYGKVRSYTQPYINTKFSISKINENLYIGDFPSACNKRELLKLGITHIVTVAVGINAMFPDDFKYHLIDVCDTKTTSIYDHLDVSSKFIDNAIENDGKIYVHCMCGISRSATIIAAYLIYKYKYTVEEAIAKIRECRECIKPNEGFEDQLKIYSNHVHNQTADKLENML